MAEIGVVASVIGVAAVGFRLSLVLNAVGCEIASAGVEIHSISKGVTMFALMLKQVGNALQESDSVHSSEAVETAQEISDQCQVVFDEIQEMLDKVTTKRKDGTVAPSIQQKFKWCFKKGRVQYLLGQLESLKLSLLVMLQILQLGKTMATPVKGAPKEEITAKSDDIAQERAETQNLVIVRYWQLNRMDRLYVAAEREEEEERQQIENSINGSSGNLQLAIEAPPAYVSSNALIRLPIVSLGELDTTLNKIKESPRDMLRVSESVIDPLLDRWTDWRDVLERQEARPAGRYSPSVQNVYESEEEKARYFDEDYERDESPRGYFLEGATTDWRKPHSTEARKEYNRRKKRYANMQPSISVESSDVEDGSGSRTTKKRAPSAHVIDSGSETSESEPEVRPARRRSNANYDHFKKPSQRSHKPSFSHSYTNGSEHRNSFGGRRSLSPYATPNSTPRSSISAPRSPTTTHRPAPNPAQNPYQHANTSPLPPLHIIPQHHLQQPHPGPYSPSLQNPQMPYNRISPVSAPAYQGNFQYYPPQRLMPPHPPPGHPMAMPLYPRPGSQDGKSHRSRSPPRYTSRSVHSQRSYDDMRKAERSRRKRNVTKGAAKGVLGAGALAGFLEALEGIDL